MPYFWFTVHTLYLILGDELIVYGVDFVIIFDKLNVL